jgi:Flp pilus assembly protein TadG
VPTRILPTRALRVFARDARGVSAIEFGILAFPFFLIIYAILESTFVFVAGRQLDQATQVASRLVRTGEMAVANMTQDAFRQRICDQVKLLLTCDKIRIDLKEYKDFGEIPTRKPISNGALDASGFVFERAKAGRKMALRTYYEWPLYADVFNMYLSDLKNGGFLLSSVNVMRVEPFNDKAP